MGQVQASSFRRMPHCGGAVPPAAQLKPCVQAGVRAALVPPSLLSEACVHRVSYTAEAFEAPVHRGPLPAPKKRPDTLPPHA